MSAPPTSDIDWDSLIDRYEYFIWDFDGTLVHLRVDWQGLKARLIGLIGGLAPDATMGNIAAEARKRGLQELVWEMIAGAEVQGLESLPKRVEQLRRVAERSAILTNNMSRTVQHFLETERLPQLPIVSLDRVALPKPNPEGIMRLASLWEGRRGLVIGDSEWDQVVASAAGLEVVLLPREDCDAG